MLENILARIKEFVQGIISLDLISKISSIVAKVAEVLAQIKDWLFGIVTKFFGG